MNEKQFVIRLAEPYYKPDDLLSIVSVEKVYNVKVVKVYKLTLWKKILLKLGFKYKYMNCVLVKEIE